MNDDLIFFSLDDTSDNISQPLENFSRAVWIGINIRIKCLFFMSLYNFLPDISVFKNILKKY